MAVDVTQAFIPSQARKPSAKDLNDLRGELTALQLNPFGTYSELQTRLEEHRRVHASEVAALHSRGERELGAIDALVSPTAGFGSGSPFEGDRMGDSFDQLPFRDRLESGVPNQSSVETQDADNQESGIGDSRELDDMPDEGYEPAPDDSAPQEGTLETADQSLTDRSVATVAPATVASEIQALRQSRKVP